MQVWGFSSGAGLNQDGRIQVQRSAFSYQHSNVPGQELQTQLIAQRASCTLCVLLATICLVNIYQIYVGLQRLNERCDEPLARWLVGDGASELFVMLLGVLAYFQMCGFQGEDQIQAQQVQDSEHGRGLLQYSAHRGTVSPVVSRALGFLPCAVLLAVASFLLGCILHAWVESCDLTLQQATSITLSLKPFLGLMLLCCGPCCAGAAIGAAPTPHPSLEA
eukprot:TRINITY_DN45945_c0_g1_i1.p1 TRINITY_DN45945_c0_g1~~TRINITY_DN45945_c0_g1_i1.p1  ORF type:complete len:220 (+),score=26.03 TRINITY_DN45945_c0_g1_i1:146-805(+)